MNERLVTDTMALVLRLERRRLPQAVKLLFETAEHGNGDLYISAMVMAEIGYLSERHRIDTTLQEVMTYCATYPRIVIWPLSHDIILRSFQIDDIPELHDRLIAGTAAVLQLPLLTNDPVITQSRHVTVIW